MKNWGHFAIAYLLIMTVTPIIYILQFVKQIFINRSKSPIHKLKVSKCVSGFTKTCLTFVAFVKKHGWKYLMNKLSLMRHMDLLKVVQNNNDSFQFSVTPLKYKSWKPLWPLLGVLYPECNNGRSWCSRRQMISVCLHSAIITNGRARNMKRTALDPPKKPTHHSLVPVQPEIFCRSKGCSLFTSPLRPSVRHTD